MSAFLHVKPGETEELRAAIGRFQARLRNAPKEYMVKFGLVDMRHVIFDNGTRLCWITAFDTDWDPYIDDSITTLGLATWIDWAQHTVEYDPELAHRPRRGEGVDPVGADPGRRVLPGRPGHDPGRGQEGPAGARRVRPGPRRPPGGRGPPEPRPQAAARRGRGLTDPCPGRPAAPDTRRPETRRVVHRVRPLLRPPRPRRTAVRHLRLLRLPQPERPGNLVLAMDVVPRADASSTFSDGVVYRFRVRSAEVEGRAVVPGTDELTVDVRFDAARPDGQAGFLQTGTCTTSLGESVPVLVDASTTAGRVSGVRAFAGLRSDPFFLDFAALQKTLASGRLAFADPGTLTGPGADTLGLVVEIDRDVLAEAGVGPLVAAVAETVSAGPLPIRLERVGRPEVKNFLLALRTQDPRQPGHRPA